MTPKEFVDNYIEGGPGNYYFNIEIIWGRSISGGSFYYKNDARNAFINKLMIFLNDPEGYMYPNRDEKNGRTKTKRRQNNKTKITNVP